MLVMVSFTRDKLLTIVRSSLIDTALLLFNVTKNAVPICRQWNTGLGIVPNSNWWQLAGWGILVTNTGWLIVDSHLKQVFTMLISEF